MYIWDVLEIRPTKDKGKIQEAYAKLTKEYHPEEYPEEFKKIQQAYKQAIKYTKDTVRYNSLLDDEIEIIKKVYNSKEENISNETKNIDTYEGFNEKSEFDFSKIEARKNQQGESYYEGDYSDFYRVKNSEAPYDIEDRVKYIEEFMAMFKVLGHHMYTRNNVDCWRLIFEDSRYTKLYDQGWFITAIMSGIDKLDCLNISVLEYWDCLIGRNSPTGYDLPITIVLDNKIRKQRGIKYNNVISEQQQIEYDFIKKKVDDYQYRNCNKDTLFAKLYLESSDELEYLRYEYSKTLKKREKKEEKKWKMWGVLIYLRVAIIVTILYLLIKMWIIKCF